METAGGSGGYPYLTLAGKPYTYFSLALRVDGCTLSGSLTLKRLNSVLAVAFADGQRIVDLLVSEIAWTE